MLTVTKFYMHIMEPEFVEYDSAILIGITVHLERSQKDLLLGLSKEGTNSSE